MLANNSGAAAGVKSDMSRMQKAVEACTHFRNSCQTLLMENSMTSDPDIAHKTCNTISCSAVSKVHVL
jgi:hypothetical protein